mmetsp:Transcript_5822/g.22708  ORF Transcript_5822/g.22708 Transcript_5822/m.22708 type:complete len:232 (+) Transcript_5822:234-929(+)
MSASSLLSSPSGQSSKKSLMAAGLPLYVPLYTVAVPPAPIFSSCTTSFMSTGRWRRMSPFCASSITRLRQLCVVKTFCRKNTPKFSSMPLLRDEMISAMHRIAMSCRSWSWSSPASSSFDAAAISRDTSFESLNPRSKSFPFLSSVSTMSESSSTFFGPRWSILSTLTRLVILSSALQLNTSMASWIWKAAAAASVHAEYLQFHLTLSSDGRTRRSLEVSGLPLGLTMALW